MHETNLLENNDHVLGQEHLIKTILHPQGKFTLCVGGDSLGLLYCAYTLIETQFGVRFRLTGDIIPENFSIHKLVTETVQLRKNPVFEKRGLQPFHDFPEGPDWWNTNEYKLYLAQMAKMKMNFIGLHTYPLVEPEVWVGTQKDYLPNGDVTYSYRTRWMTTLEGSWGYTPKNTSNYIFGNSLVFPSDCFGAEVMEGLCPAPTNQSEFNELFNRVGQLFNDVFEYAHTLGIQTCVGTETPLSKPDRSISTQDYYEGTFGRINKTYPIDYYWFWTPEGWEWDKVNISDPVVKEVVADLAAAKSAHDAVGAPFELATCGWVVGPGSDRNYWDTVLSPEWTITSIDMNVGQTPVDPAYALIKNHKKWDIPWLEDDPGLSVIQLWVNRTLQHGIDAQTYGCQGLLGLHWRTREVEPQLGALAQFTWDNTTNSINYWSTFTADEFGVGVAAEKAAQIFISVDSFKLPRPVDWIAGPGGMAPNTLPWSQVSTHYSFVEEFSLLRPMVVGVANQERFDFWANSLLYMEAVAETECIWGSYNSVVEKVRGVSRDPAQQRILSKELVIPVRETLVQQVGTLFQYLRKAISSVGTLGTIMNIEQHSIPSVLEAPGAELAALMGYIGCYTDTNDRDLNGTSFQSSKMTPGMCLDFCKEHYYSYYGTQFGLYCFCGNSYGKYGSVDYTQCNVSCGGDTSNNCGGVWHNSIYSVDLSVLPSSAMPPKTYNGEPHLVVPTARLDLAKNEQFTQTALVFSSQAPLSVTFSWRGMGTGEPWKSLPMKATTEGRQVYTIALDMTTTTVDFEYYIYVIVDGQQLYFPATAPAQPHTVIVV